MNVNRYFINKLTDDICNYIDWLQESEGYQISVHGVERTSCSTWNRFLKYYYHQCTLCLTVKGSASAWAHCIERQPGMRGRVGRELLLGTCYAGVTEYVFPLLDIHGEPMDKSENGGFLCVSGFTRDRANAMERAMFVADKYGLSREMMARAVAALRDDIPEREVVIRQIAPIQDMFSMLFHFCDLLYDSDENSSPQEALYMQMVREVNRCYRDPDFSLNELCARLNVSYSHASHVFSNFSDVPFRRYLRRLRVTTAKEYLEYSMVAIGLIATECGFEDSNYFSSTFHAETGITPSAWRAACFRAHAKASDSPDAAIFRGTALPPK